MKKAIILLVVIVAVLGLLALTAAARGDDEAARFDITAVQFPVDVCYHFCLNLAPCVPGRWTLNSDRTFVDNLGLAGTWSYNAPTVRLQYSLSMNIYEGPVVNGFKAAYGDIRVPGPFPPIGDWSASVADDGCAIDIPTSE